MDYKNERKKEREKIGKGYQERKDQIKTEKRMEEEGEK